MATAVGFQKLTIRILDGKSPTDGTNLFTIQGDKDKGATSSAKIAGLAPTITKTYGSNKVYNQSGKGVGDATVTIDIVDLPDAVQAAILGLTVSDNNVHKATSETQAPYCAILLEDEDQAGHPIMLGFPSGMFSQDGSEWDTGNGQSKETPSEEVVFSVGSDDDGLYYETFLGKGDSTDTAGVAEVKSDLQMVAAAQGGGE